jgi:hypothetical protein
MVAPSGSTASSNSAWAEWFPGAVSGSVPGGQAPSIANAPGTSSSTKEKSSAPVIGLAASSARGSPNSSVAVARANSASPASLTVTGYSVRYSASTVSRCASPICRTSCGTISFSAFRAPGL